MKEFFARFLSPHSLVVEGFVLFILTGAALLSLPAASSGPERLPFLDALFTATSAVCVTGLSVIDIGSRLSSFGQWVLLALFQFGALGITAFSTFLLVLAGRRLSVRSEFALMDAYGTKKVKGLKSLLIWTFGFTLLFEAVGCALFFLWFTRPEGAHTPLPPAEAWYPALFHSVSCFCNAGFALYADSLEGFRDAPLFLSATAVLILSGSLGFIVLYNLATIKWWRRDLRKRGKLTLHTKVVLIATAALLLFAFATTLALEWNGTLQGMPAARKLWCAAFHAVSPRTAGFTILPTTGLHEGTRMITEFMMFVGGSPASVSGGAKTTTMVILLMTVLAMCHKRNETVIFARTVPNSAVRESIVIVLLLSSLIAAAYFTMVCIEPSAAAGRAPRLFFETLSACSTSGLSMDTTATLRPQTRLLLIFCMFVGRLGPLTIAVTMSGHEEPQRIHYSEEDIVVG